MPLHLGNDYTSRPTIISWDPSIVSEEQDAMSKLSELLSDGFVVRNKIKGEIILTPPKKPKNIGILRVLTKNGDDRITWDRTRPEEIKDAIQQFSSLKNRGYRAFAVTSDGKRGHEIETFDHNAEEVLMVPKTRPS